MMHRIGKVDFFAALPAGFYVLLVISIAMGIGRVSGLEGAHSMWGPMVNLASEIGAHPALLVFVIFASYLAGVSLRVLPVQWMENVIPPFGKEFPYVTSLKNVAKELKTHKEASRVDERTLPELGNEVPESVYNYWKDYLCMNSSEGFSYYESFEARTRFFCCMLWAGFIGILCGVTVFIKEVDSGWIDRSVVFLISLAIVLLFGGQFRRVRKQEANVLFTLFIVDSQKCDDA